MFNYWLVLNLWHNADLLFFKNYRIEFNFVNVPYKKIKLINYFTNYQIIKNIRFDG